MKILIFILIIFLNTAAAEWRPYDIYRCGAKGLAVGGAFTAIADDVSAIYFNPAGLVQVKNSAVFYTMDSQIKLEGFDPKLKLTYEVPALLGFVYPSKDKYNTALAFAVYSPFQRKIPNEFAMYKFAPAIAMAIGKQFTVGLNLGVNYATYTESFSSDGWGFSYQTGLLYHPYKELHFGLNYQSKVKIDWGSHGAIADLKETFPDILTIGIAVLLTPKLVGSIDFEYQNWSAIEFIEDGNNTAPFHKIENGFFKTLHPHIGVMFLEEKTGAHFRTGFFSDSFFDGGAGEEFQNKTQVLWTVGLGVYALKILKIEVALADSYLL
ncbi:MAG: outer membrane protein transport protein, partial [Spirochaetes bacterium]|nr:outer membrane protein transport protein [Spirochaetota bacterium]